jgi:hypothetical protein
VLEHDGQRAEILETREMMDGVVGEHDLVLFKFLVVAIDTIDDRK